MATIYLIRHGQAQFGMAEYDALSPTGIEQAKWLGHALSKQQVVPTKVISGAMQRHQQTTHYCLASMGLDQLSVETVSGWNEFDHRDILACFDPRYADIENLKKDILLDANPKQKVTMVMTGAILRWTSGQHTDYKESWTAFRSRITDSLKVLSGLGKEEVVLVFTSGGSISVVLQEVLQLSVHKTFELQLNIANCSVTKLKTSSLGWRLLSLSEHAHFSGEKGHWLTYR